MKKLLLLGGLRYLIPVIKKAKELGCYVITCDYLPDNIAHNYSDEYHNVSIIDKEAVLSLAKRLKIDGIMSFAVDPGVLTAAYVAEKLSLPSCGPYKSVEILQNKGLFRKFLKDNDFVVPQAQTYADKAEALKEIHSFTLPVIVKPVDAAGSKGVSKVECISQLELSLDFAFQHSIVKHIIVEEFIEAKGFASDSECFSIDGKMELVTFSSQRFDVNAENPYTPAAFSWPSSISEANILKLKQELQRLISLLGMRTCLYNVEVRESNSGKAYLMEVSPRGGGNRLAEMVHFVTNINLIEYAIKAAVGEDLDHFPNVNYTGYWGEVILHSQNAGSFKEISIAKGYEKYVVEEDLWVDVGDRVNSFRGASDSIGTVVLKFDSENEMLDKMSKHKEWINVIVF